MTHATTGQGQTGQTGQTGQSPETGQSPLGSGGAEKGATPAYTVPGLDSDAAGTVAALLQQRLDALTDLHLTLKHVHWNVVGPNFISVHEMLDPQVEAVRAMADAVAERIATLGFSPVGTPGALVSSRSWDDYSLGRAGAIEHLGALEVVYRGVISDHRDAMRQTEEPDPVTQDLLIDQLRELELFQWFIRAHLENAGGEISTAEQSGEQPAAKVAGTKAATGTGDDTAADGSSGGGSGKTVDLR